MLVGYLADELQKRCNSTGIDFTRHNETHISIYVRESELYKVFFLGYGVLSKKPY